MGLREYHRKRDFAITPEPKGAEPKASGRSYCIQKHAATRLHYDFRLEMEGVLKSWAVPKGPSLDPADKRLAMQTEDHPIEYGDFEGIIPKGQYGGGTVLLWDRGTWEPLEDPHQGLRKGALKFRLDGEKLQGKWTLVKIKGRDRARRREDAGCSSRSATSWCGRPACTTSPRSDRRAWPPAGRWSRSRRTATACGTPTAESREKPRESRGRSGGALRARRAWPARSRRHPRRGRPRDSAPRPRESGGRHTGRAQGGAALHRQGAARHARRRAAEGRRVAARDEVRRLPDPGPAPGRQGAAAQPEREGLDRALPHRGRRRWRRSPCARRSSTARSPWCCPAARTSFQALQNALAAADQGQLAYFLFDLVHLETVSLARAPLEERKTRAEGPARHAVAGITAALQRPRDGVGAGVLRAGLHARRRRHRVEAPRRAVRAGPLEVLAQDQVPSAPGIRDRRIHRSRRLSRGPRRAAPRRPRRAAARWSSRARSAPGSPTKTLADLRRRLAALEQPQRLRSSRRALPA